MQSLPADTPCPCGSPKSYGDCCGKYHCGNAYAETAEKLMRSRYSAFALRDGKYLLSTLAEENRSGFNDESIAHDTTRWIGLEIIECVAGGVLDQSGIVEFIARFDEDGKHNQLHERSNFERRDGKWFYVDGIFPGASYIAAPDMSLQRQNAATAEAGRNDPCPSGSRTKFKKCCG